LLEPTLRGGSTSDPQTPAYDSMTRIAEEALSQVQVFGEATENR
jgi:hypothetical protein